MPTFLLLLLGLAAGWVRALGSSREGVPAVVALPLKNGKTGSILNAGFPNIIPPPPTLCPPTPLPPHPRPCIFIFFFFLFFSLSIPCPYITILA